MPGRYATATFTEWLPDSTGIVFVGTLKDSGVPLAGGQVLLQPYPSGKVRRVTNDLVEYRTAHVTGDGRSILAVGFDAVSSLWTAPLANPSAIQRVPSLIGDGRYGVNWSGDGQRIFFGGSARDVRQISSIARDGSDRREFAADGHASWPSVAPDNSFITFFGNHVGQFGLWRARLDGGDIRQLAADSDASYEAVSPDGRWLYYSSSVSGVGSTWRVPTDGSAAPAVVVPGLERAAVSPDGTRLAGLYIAAPGGLLLLGILPSGGGPPVQVFPGFAPASGAGSIVWDLDGASVLYSTVERANIWRQRLGGGAPEKVTSYSDLTIFRFALSRGGELALARGTQTRDAVLITNFR
jgi:WD40 repeat protein